MNYRIQQLTQNVKQYQSWVVIESRTKYIIETFIRREDARKFARKLNNGAGFDGWSPSFMTTREMV